MEETESLSFSEVNRIIQSVPCSDAQLQRLADCAQIDGEARVLELAETLTLTAQCWVSMFGCPIEVNTAAGFFAQAEHPTPPPRAAMDEEDPDYALAFGFTPRPDALRYDCVLWHLSQPLETSELERFCRKIRASLNVNGCLILTLPVRIGLKPSAEVDAFYAELGARPTLPQDVAMALETSGFEPLCVEFAHNRQTLARYRMIEHALSRCPSADESVHVRWKREVKLFLKEGGISFFPSSIFVARRWEYVDGS